MDMLRFPIGEYNPPEVIDQSVIDEWILDISIFPSSLTKRIQNIDAADLKKQYRPDGWNVAQLIHHCADSHMNCFIRFKLGLTEDNPTIKPYLEADWAKLPDVEKVPIDISVQLLSAVHYRWTVLLKSMTAEQLKRTVVHPEHGETFSLEYLIGMYSWHGRHHLAHIDLALN